MRSRPTPLTVFVHIPKNAGTTFTDVLKTNFPTGTVGLRGNVFNGMGGIDRRPLARFRDGAEVLIRDLQVLRGHIPFGIHTYLPPDARYVTLLRDPVDRTLSHYYSLVVMHRRRGRTGETSIEGLHEAGLLIDNIQTRMLSNAEEPEGEVTDATLAEAKENLSSAFTVFGIVERFDESLVLAKRALGFKSILYKSRRIGKRPEAPAVPPELREGAKRLNAYDVELYRWAAERFDRTVGEQDVDFSVDLEGLRAARSNRLEEPDVPADLDREALWRLLVRKQAELLQRDFDLARADSKREDRLTSLLELANANIRALTVKLEKHAPVSDADLEDDLEDPAREPANRRRLSVERANMLGDELRVSATRLEVLRAEIRALEEKGGPAAEVRLERLRAAAARLEKRMESAGARRARALTQLNRP